MTDEEKDNAFREDCQRCYEDEIKELLTQDAKAKEIIKNFLDYILFVPPEEKRDRVYEWLKKAEDFIYDRQRD